MSRFRNQVAKLTAIACGWVVVVATTFMSEPVDHTDLEVELALGPDAPSTAIVDVRFEGAFLEKSNALCAFVWSENEWFQGPWRDLEVEFLALETLGETSTEPGGVQLYTAVAPLTDNVGHGACIYIACGTDEPCGGRFSVRLVDGARSDAGVDPEQLDPFPLVISAVTYAHPGKLPGAASVTLVETRP